LEFFTYICQAEVLTVGRLHDHLLECTDYIEIEGSGGESEVGVEEVLDLIPKKKINLRLLQCTNAVLCWLTQVCEELLEVTDLFGSPEFPVKVRGGFLKDLISERLANIVLQHEKVGLLCFQE
jgi:hypothetical protein